MQSSQRIPTLWELDSPKGCRRNRAEFRPEGRPVEFARDSASHRPSGLRPPLTSLSRPLFRPGSSNVVTAASPLRSGSLSPCPTTSSIAFGMPVAGPRVGRARLGDCLCRWDFCVTPTLRPPSAQRIGSVVGSAHSPCFSAPRPSVPAHEPCRRHCQHQRAQVVSRRRRQAAVFRPGDPGHRQQSR